MSPTKTQVLSTQPQKVLDLVASWIKIFDTLETRAQSYRGYVENPGGSSWEGKTAQAAKDRARDDVQAVTGARDTIDTQATSITNAVSSSLWPPLTNAQTIIGNAEQVAGVTVHEDLSITYDPPEGTSEKAAAQTRDQIGHAAQELKDAADQWWTAEQAVAGQITGLQHTLNAELSSAPMTYHLGDAFQLAPGEAITLEPGETHNVGPIAGTGAPPIHDDATGRDLNALDLGEIVKLPDGRLVAVFGDSFTDGPGRGDHYPSVAIEATIDPATGQISYGNVLSGPDGSGRELFPIPDSVRQAHPEATFTLPAGTITANGKTYMKVAATDGHLQPTGGSWLVEITNHPGGSADPHDPNHGWTAIDGSYRDWKYDHTPTPEEPWRVTGRPDNAPSQISGYQGSDGRVHIAADSFDRSRGVTMYQVDNPADVADPSKWRPLLPDGNYGHEGQPATRIVSPAGQSFGELSLREIDGRPVLSGLNRDGAGVEVRVGAAGHPEEIFNSIPTVVGGIAPGPAQVPYPYSGFIVPEANGNMPHLDKMGILVSQWTPWGQYNTQQVWANVTSTQ